MKTLILFLRSLLFYIYTATTYIILLPIFILVIYIIKDERICIIFVRLCAALMLFYLKKTVKLDYVIENKEILDNCKGPAIIASKHQSMWETVALWVEFGENSSVILHSGLKKIPLYGHAIQVLPNIIINKNKSFTAIRYMIKEATHLVTKRKRNIIIFPEGKRTNVGEKVNYSNGVYLLYKTLNIPVITIALNAGEYWPTKKFIKYPGIITARITNVIPPNLEHQEFRKNLQDYIENASEELITKKA